MENVLLDRSSGSFEFPRRAVGFGGCRPGLGARLAAPSGAYGSIPATCFQQQQQAPYLHKGGGAWNSTPALPYARPPPIYSSPSLPLLPSNQPPLLPLPPAATKYATYPYPPPPPPAPRTGRVAATSTTSATVQGVSAPPTSRQGDRRRRPRPAEPARAQRKKTLERATPLPPAPAVAEALDDLEQEMARTFVQDLLHALAPPPSSLPLPSFSLVVKAPPSTKVAAPAAAQYSCNAEAAAADGIRRLLRL